MRILMLAVLFLVSCGPGLQRREYRQSALPGAAEFSAAEDAPHNMGQPGYTRESPLLKTEPPFPVASSTPDSSVLGIRIPVPAEELEATPVNQCLMRMHKTLQADDARRQVINAASEEKRRCIVHQILAGCLIELKAEIEEAQNKGGAQLYAPAVDALTRVQALAQRRADRSCAGIIGKQGTLTDEEHDAWVQVSRKLETGMQEGTTRVSGGNETRAAKRWDMNTAPVLRGVTLPFPADADTYEARVTALVCADTMTRALVVARQHVRFDNLSPEERRRCVAANLYLSCAKYLLEMYRASSAIGAPSAREKIPAHEATAWAAQAFVTKSCGKKTSWDDVMIRETYTAWHEVTFGKTP